MQSKQLSGPKPGVPSQKFLDIAEIREDTVIMKDGTLRAVLLVSSINFALKSVDEQNAIVQAYMAFLNGIDFPIQIVIQSRKMNVDGYVKQLEGRESEINNELLKKQIRDYRDFVKQLVKLGEIMQKRFFVIVPLNPATDKRKNFFQRLAEILSPSLAVHLSEEKFKKQKFDLELRVNQIVSGLSSMSLNAVQLDTQSLIELYYNVYNPELLQTQPLTEVGELQLEG
ncbi:MAG TPA: TraC family protein [Patescibacteria group bacterium]|nr:TraC family protein [Patescibacteria group bacterium]